MEKYNSEYPDKISKRMVPLASEFLLQLEEEKDLHAILDQITEVCFVFFFCLF
jgi:hypothetical protein